MMKKSEPSYIAGGNRKWCSHSITVWLLIGRLNIELYDPAITLLGIYARKIKTYVHTKTCS